MSNRKAICQAKKIFTSKERAWVKKIILIRHTSVIKIFIRKNANKKD